MRYAPFLICVVVTAALGSPLAAQGSPTESPVMVGVGSTDDVKLKLPAAGITADSLVVLKKLITSKKVMLVLNGSISPAKAIEAVKAKQVAEVTFAEPSVSDLKYYGDKAKNGILTIKTGTAGEKGREDEGRGAAGAAVLKVIPAVPAATSPAN